MSKTSASHELINEGYSSQLTWKKERLMTNPTTSTINDLVDSLTNSWGSTSLTLNGLLTNSSTSSTTSSSASSAATYTEDITVAGSLLRDRISSLYESVVGSAAALTASTPSTNGPPTGEDVRIAKMVEKVQLVDRLGSSDNLLGTVHVTTTHIIFRAENGNKELWLATGLINSVEKGTLTAAGCQLVIRCKHFQVITLLVGRDKACQDLYETLLRCAKPVNVTELLAFETLGDIEPEKEWRKLDWDSEMQRLGVNSETWTKTAINSEFQSCDTYPSDLWVPSSTSTAVLMGSIKFRSRGRFPALTYYHKLTDAALCRCAQPLVGFSARCVEDETLMEQIGKANTNNGLLYLIDTRPRVNAVMNRVQGKGYEDERNYANLRLYSFDIENIHVMRSSQAKLLEAVTKCKEMTEYLRALESSGWLKHLRAIIECSLFIADALAKGTSCVVHCSDGWDRTSQTVAVAELLLDPFYRTIEGYQILIEKDWLGFGHKFDDRCGHVGGLNDEAAKEVSPIFTQFLDCTWQLMKQKRRAFEFNERFLIELHEHVYSCQYGTFIGNCEKDRRDLNLEKRTRSLWTWMNTRREDYLNPYYVADAHESLLDIDTRASNFTVFHSLYNRFDDGIISRERIEETTVATMEHVKVLERQLEVLKNKSAESALTSSQTSQSRPEDSGLSSMSGLTIDDDPLGVTTTKRLTEMTTSLESDASNLSGTKRPRERIAWQHLRDATRCNNPSCRGEFASLIDRRIHCHNCGKIFCHRCLSTSNPTRQRLCELCILEL